MTGLGQALHHRKLREISRRSGARHGGLAIGELQEFNDSPSQ